jgi:hypothetical protein
VNVGYIKTPPGSITDFNWIQWLVLRKR